MLYMVEAERHLAADAPSGCSGESRRDRRDVAGRAEPRLPRGSTSPGAIDVLLRDFRRCGGKWYDFHSLLLFPTH
jgi:hypothetical protein